MSVSLLSRRARFTDTPGQFLATCEATLAAQALEELDEVDDEFLRRYGTPLNDGRSVERALRTIRTIVSARGRRTEE